MDLVRISATAHGLNYLPEYHARATGIFARLGLEVMAQARDPWTGVLDDLANGQADLALGGLWVPAMYAGKARDLVVVGQLNARFPALVLTREPVDDFTWSWMKGRTVLAPGAGGLAYTEFTAGVMREHGVDPAATLFVRDLSTPMLVELYQAGLGDALVSDPLTAAHLESQGAGFISCKMAEVCGPMPNSVYYTRRDLLDGLHDKIVRFLAGVSASMATLTSTAKVTSTDPGIADLLGAEWPDLPLGVLQSTTGELVGNGTWDGIRIDPQACDRWVSILTDAHLINRKVPYGELVDNAAVDAAERLQIP